MEFIPACFQNPLTVVLPPINCTSCAKLHSGLDHFCCHCGQITYFGLMNSPAIPRHDAPCDHGGMTSLELSEELTSSFCNTCGEEVPL